ncbi:MAG: cyclic nucleotide-binding domain-containing protein [Nitrospirae bacterium]|nr:cyclic nucleotide-binding domain-containing protein [Nitrospirota bacterium]
MDKGDFNFSYLMGYLYNSIKSQDVDEAYDTFMLILDLVFIGKEVPPFFAELLDKATLRTLDDIELRKYSNNETICKEGEHGESMYIIVSGNVRVSQKKVKAKGPLLPIPPVLINHLITNMLMGGPKTLSTLSVGDFFGESALFSAKPMPVTATATSDVEVLVITAKSLQKAMSIKPNLRSLLKEYYVSRLDSMFESLQKEQSSLQSCMFGSLLGAAMPAEESNYSNSSMLLRSAGGEEGSQRQSSFSLRPQSQVELGLEKIRNLYAGNHKPEAALLYMTLSRLFFRDIVGIVTDKFALKVLDNPKIKKIKVLSDVLNKVQSIMPEKLPAVEVAEETDYRRNFLALFNDLLKRKLDKVLQQQYKQGQTIINHGDMSDSIYVIKTGAVRVHPLDALPDNVESKDIILGKGEIFGEISFFTKQPISATVVASEDTSIYELNRPLVTEIVKEYPEVYKFFEKVYQDRINNLIKEAEAVKAYYQNDLVI